MKKFKGHFLGPSVRPTRPIRPIRPIKLGLRPRFRKGYHWALEGHCGCLVEENQKEKKFVFFQLFAKKGLPPTGENKM